MPKRIRVRSPQETTPAAPAPVLMDGWLITIHLSYGKRAFRFIRPDAAAELLTERERHLRGHIKLPTASEVMLTRGSKTIGQRGLWRLSFAPISSQEFYSLESV